MKRRDAIKSAVLGAIALPTAAMKVSPAAVPVAEVGEPKFLCTATWNTGLAGITATAKLSTDDMYEMIEFIWKNSEIGTELSVCKHGKLIYTRNGSDGSQYLL